MSTPPAPKKMKQAPFQFVYPKSISKQSGTDAGKITETALVASVQLWISEKDRRQIRTAPQMDRAFYVGVFREAQEKKDHVDFSAGKVKF